MKLFKASNLAQHQLVLVYADKPEWRSEIEEEWVYRYGLKYPFFRNIQSQILNMETHEVFTEEVPDGQLKIKDVVKDE